uniref:Uncharacterized protein n=1 Tax=Ditylum brightwellii TaxID=49249 RepID=A0A6V2QGL2_9STRA
MRYDVVLYLSGISTLISVLLSTYLIATNFNKWKIKSTTTSTNILIIVLMAPIFAIDSFVSLLELEEGEIVAHLLDMFKECYESITLHAFLMLMYSLLGLTKDMIQGEKPIPDEMKGRELHVPFPLSLFMGKDKHPKLDQKWLQKLRIWTIQFVFLRPLLSTVDILFVDHVIPLHNEHVTSIIKLIVTISLNVSVTTAFCALITFYHAFEHELAPHRPLAKFICIKGVVFFTTWQGVILKLLGHFGVLHEGYRFSLDEIELAWQDLLVCMEMAFIFSPLCVYAFSNADEKVKEIELKEQKVAEKEETKKTK